MTSPFVCSRLLPLLAMLLALLLAPFAHAADGATEQAQRQGTQPGNNAPVWREVRSGAPQVTTVRGRETNILIQPQGETWRALRVPVSSTTSSEWAPSMHLIDFW